MKQQDTLDKLNELKEVQKELRDLQPSVAKIELGDSLRMALSLIMNENILPETTTRELISKLRNQLNLLQKRDEQNSNQDALRTT